MDASLAGKHIHFVTGKLSEHALRNMLERLAKQLGFKPTVQVLKITVAALMTTDWIAPRIEVPEGTDCVVIPGLCKGNMKLLEEKAGVPVERGPEDCRRLDEWFGQKRQDLDGYGQYDIEVIAEINTCIKCFPDCYVRVAGFDNIKQVQCSAFLAHRPASEAACAVDQRQVQG